MTSARLRLVATLALAPLLSGCVAALIPVAAGGALFGKDKIGSSGGSRSAEAVEPNVIVEAIAETEAAPAPAEVPAAVEVIATVVPIEAVPVTELAMAEAPAGEVIVPSDPVQEAFSASPAIEMADAPTQLAAVTELPATLSTPVTADAQPAVVPIEIPAPTQRFEEAFAPSPNESEQATSQVTQALAPAPLRPDSAQPALIYGPTDYRSYDALYSYVDSQARRDPVQSSRQSALLAAPGTLSPIRTDCSIRPPAVLIDLDPGSATFDPSIKAQPNPALSQLLASLRVQEVEVFWISELSAIQAGAVRKALIGSAMDPAGRDGLLLMRRIEDRKQARRKELSETHCLLAIAGDTRADFDELYLYLKDTSTAQPLESLIGAGWFITPLPLSAPIPNPEG